jgi:hypothetical protein
MATENYKTRRRSIHVRRDAEWARAEQQRECDAADSTQRRDTELRQAHDKYQRLRADIYGRYESDSQSLHERHYKHMTASRVQHEREWQALIDRWQEGMTQLYTALENVNREVSGVFPDWTSPSWSDWQTPTNVPPAMLLGSYQVDLDRVSNAIPIHGRLKLTIPAQFTLPSLLPFPRKSSLLIKTNEEGRTASVQVLQAVLLRYLTGLPAGKVRFTIIDPMGLGENFASFMHLADYDEALVNSRIWTEQGHIEQRLADLTGHMENVIQMYLRNQYETIEDYNVDAGEVAEPFRVLVVANFPANFNSEAARRLVSIVSSGARCGVYALISLDTTQELPHNFGTGALEQHCVNLEWQGQRHVWKDPDFECFPFRAETPPAAEFCTHLFHVVGEKARTAKRVEVPFEFIVPPLERWWSGDSRVGIDVPLGRVGATKRQRLALGQGTSQHALVAGKTGSGKSTLLHALITNCSLLYSPEEVELYLIDFKKGVEFKAYAEEELPHARVVAIESDREFGLSVLQRLDAELKIRGERFREAGAQDLKAYREANGKVTMPRILLIVDEFQEFFLEDDRVSQDAGQLLDRLVRQGRAFGLHVLLGSQTLGGAYTLARSTIDQMAVRITLQCSEADARLILSDDNTAARLLSRPGEAIYNDANGMVEGNNPFQVVWLPEPRRQDYLRRIQEMDRKHHPGLLRSHIVFEGNAPADVSKNPLLHEVLRAPTWPVSQQAAFAWLGEALAIKEPTAATFRRQSGSNLLVVGQQEQAARGMLVTTVVGLAAQQRPATDDDRASASRFCVLDGTPTESADAAAFTKLADIIPHPVRAASCREAPAILAELTAEVELRKQANEVNRPTIYLFIFGLQRFRDLRRDEDDFGLSPGEASPSPAKQLAGLLREGAGLGIHVVVWCDSLNNVQRAFDRQALREFEMRVLFQMSANDSSTLIDSPLAGKLGMHRALYQNEEEGRAEKFRPYGLPSVHWLQGAREHLHRKQWAEPARQRVS